MSTHKSHNRVFTVGDRRAQVEKHGKLQADYYDAIQTAQGRIQELATGLKNRFGKYDTGHYYNDLIHQAHKSHSTQRVNRWNAYVRATLHPGL